MYAFVAVYAFVCGEAELGCCEGAAGGVLHHCRRSGDGDVGEDEEEEVREVTSVFICTLSNAPPLPVSPSPEPEPTPHRAFITPTTPPRTRTARTTLKAR